MPNFNTPEWEKLFGKLLFDIQTRSCILMIGPEIVQIGDQGLQRHLRDSLEPQHKDDIEHYYGKEGLFLFRNQASKNEVQRSVNQYFHGLKPDLSVYKTIAEIPFPLVVSVNPDHFLRKALGDAAHFAASFNHHAGSNGASETEGWDGQSTLVYNLCGAYTEDASVILDYDDLFNFLKTVLGPVGLPDSVRGRLRRAKSFLFVGFQFDRWYTQLLLRLLNEGASPTQIALNTQLGDREAHHFLLKRYNMQFLGRVFAEQTDADTPPPLESGDIGSLEFLTELNRRWKGAQAEQDEYTEQPTGASVRRLVGRGDLDKALKILPGLLSDPEDLDMATLLNNWYANWKREAARGVEDSRTLENRYNKVLNGILEQLKLLPA